MIDFNTMINEAIKASITEAVNKAVVEAVASYQSTNQQLLNTIDQMQDTIIELNSRLSLLEEEQLTEHAVDNMISQSLAEPSNFEGVFEGHAFDDAVREVVRDVIRACL